MVITSLASDEAGLTNRLCGSIRVLGIVSGQAFTICGIAQAIIRRQYMMLLSTESKIKQQSAIINVILWCIDW